MRIKKISFSNFRNLSQETLDLSYNNSDNQEIYKNIFISGKNGQGKTSVLEAIFILSHVRTFRSSSLRDVISIKKSEDKKDKGVNLNLKYAYVSGIIETELGEVELEISIEGKKRDLLINKKRVQSLDSFCGVLKTVLFTPEDVDIVKGAPQIRRQFLDRTLAMINPQYIALLSEYTKKIKFRNSLLKSGDLKGRNLFIEDIIRLNQKIVEKRQSIILDLKTKALNVYSKIVGNSEENFDLVYNSNFLKEGRILSTEEIRADFEKIEEKEFLLGRTLLGNHRDELKIELIRKGVRSNSKTTASQGQVRSKILSFKLSSAEIINEKTRTWPVLLLDDVEAELDLDRRGNLRDLILNYPGQVFITGTEFSELNTARKKALNLVLTEGFFDKQPHLNT